MATSARYALGNWGEWGGSALSWLRSATWLHAWHLERVLLDTIMHNQAIAAEGRWLVCNML